jgi:hypothetical protein
LYTQDINGNFIPYISPGLKVGWQFGKRGGAIAGIELSGGVLIAEKFIGGIVYGFQRNLNIKRNISYFEGQIGTPLFGIAVGRDYYHRKSHGGAVSDESYEFRTRIFVGCMGYLTFKKSFGWAYELGLVGKVPIPLEYLIDI